MNYCSKQGSGNAKVVDPSLEASRNLKVMKHSTNSELKVKSFNMSMPRDLDINLYSSGLRRHSSPDQRGKNNFNLKEFLHSCQQSLSNKIERFSPVSLDCGSSLLNQNADRYENVSRRYESSSHRETPPPTFLISRLKMLQKAESVNRENSTSECAKSETHYENSILKRLHYKLNFKKTSEIEIPVFEPDQVLTHEDPSEYNLNFADEHFGAPEISHDDIKNTAVGLNNMLGVDDVCIATDSKDSNSNENSMALESLNNLNLSDSELEIDGSFIHSDDKVRLESNDQRCVVPNEDYYGQESIQNDSHCAVNVNKHDSLISRHQENQVEVHIEDSVEILEEPSKSTENYEFLLKVENLDIVENISNFNCPICLGDFESGEGVVLHECLHTFCRECLINAIEFTQDALIKCPYRDRKYSCENHLQQREIKALLTLDAYEKYLRRSIKAAESLADNSFHCLTPDCPGWCMFESSINIFHCPVCYHFNCLNCCAIHEGLNCRQYQEKLKKLQKVDHDSEKTLAFLNKMIEDGKAVKCPKCDLILMKKWGCDWLKCSICTTEICWITRGPRWGPAGRGDISGGCKCGVNGVKCHPSCTYCH
ncbi:uncharacterized protein LOC129230573 [Uloborus diversus]|uniref:uncharacterized protein LOC129230573 n=1 Tax=Uloborus diversus TaxID=327109 RepID=UPI0024099011|nr:uncharacterized protein LOC129230573 [Uloborus diversus]